MDKAEAIRKKWHPAGWMPAGFREMWEYAVDLERRLNSAESRIEELEPSAPKTELRGPSAQGEAYHRGYTQGMSDALQNMPKMIAALRNPPPILVDASSIDPKILEALKARSAPEPKAEGPNPPPPEAASAGAAPTSELDDIREILIDRRADRGSKVQPPRQISVEGDKGPGGAG